MDISHHQPGYSILYIETREGQGARCVTLMEPSTWKLDTRGKKVSHDIVTIFLTEDLVTVKIWSDWTHYLLEKMPDNQIKMYRFSQPLVRNWIKYHYQLPNSQYPSFVSYMIMAVSYFNNFNNLCDEWRSLLAYSKLAAKTYPSPQREQN